MSRPRAGPPKILRGQNETAPQKTERPGSPHSKKRIPHSPALQALNERQLHESTAFRDRLSHFGNHRSLTLASCQSGFRGLFTFVARPPNAPPPPPFPKPRPTRYPAPSPQSGDHVNKVVPSAEAAVADIPSGATLMLGGFGLCGIPENLIHALVEENRRRGLTDLHTISNNMGVDGFGMGLMLEAGMIASHTGSYVGENKLLEEKVIKGELDLRLIPQGTLAERVRAGGAGIPAFFTPAGAGTLVAEGKETRTFDGRPYLLESWLRADYALVKAWKGDRAGNLIYRKTARNFNPMMATAARIAIAEVEELVDTGTLDPDAIVTPGVYVQRILQGARYEKRIERRTVRSA